MQLKKGKKKTQVTVSFGYDNNGVQIRRYGSFINPPKNKMTDAQYNRLIYQHANKVSNELMQEYHKQQALIKLGISGGILPTFALLSEEWLETKSLKNFHTINTSVDERKKLTRINKYLGEIQIDKITKNDVENCIKAIAKEGNSHPQYMGQELSGRTLNHYLATITAVLNYGKDESLLRRNAANEVIKPKMDPTSKSALTDTELSIIMEAVEKYEKPTYKVIYNILAETGMRRESLMVLDFNDVSADGKITIRRALVKNKETKKLEIKATKNGTKNIIKVSPELVEQIYALKELYSNRAEQLGDYYTKSDRICVNEDGTQIYPDTLTQHTAKFRKKYKLPYFTPHIFRHTYVSMIAPHLGLHDTALNTGHASIDGVKWYVTTNIRAVDAAAEIVRAKIRGK